MDLICFMWLKPDCRGWVEGTMEELARMVGRDRLTLGITLDSLKRQGICDLKERENQVVFIECRRMIRDAKQLEINNKRQKRFNALTNAGITHRITPKKSEVRSNTPNSPPRGADDGFEAFWFAYPRKVGKGAAERAWRKVPPDHLDRILAAVATQSQSDQWRKDGGQFIPHPSTWLNQRRWEDEALPAREERHWSEIPNLKASLPTRAPTE